MAQSLDQIRRNGLDALRRRLGRAGLVRFFQQFERGEGDYAKKRREWVDRTTLEEIQAKLGKKTKPKKKRPPA